MHSQKTKKKSDISVKVEIKKEKTELYPMSHYVDDRVELVKQIFASLKPKTIKNLAPDFLKVAPIEDIEELCLNELLGISTKRLTSIINATKCPTDTESSDSDVNNIEEHISLEEISSDSEEERTAKTQKAPEKKKRKKGQTANSQKQDGTAKEMSVLELLELQARARAIRSQLALEPIAKIEVDSDDSTISNTNSLKTEAKGKQSNDKTETTKLGKRTQNTSVNGDVASPSGSNTKRIKLKRNFRRRDIDSEPDDSRSGLTGHESQKEKSPIPVNSNDKNQDKMRKEKSPSPDIITILPSPETLCISDSSEDEHEKNEKNATKDPSIDNSIQENKEPEKREEVIEKNIEKADSEVEDGEILEKEEVDKLEGSKGKEAEKGQELEEDSESLKNNGLASEKEDVNINNTKEATEIEKEDNTVEKETPDDNEDHHIDDVISLEHEEFDYEMKEEEDKCEQQSEKLDDATELSNSPKTTPESDKKLSEEKICDHLDYIELHDDSSENENENGQQRGNNLDGESLSWNSRWLQSSKVSKILAASRLGNRVRDKIKQSKKAEQATPESKIETIAPKETFSSQFEEGSIQQYQEILEREKLNVQNNAQ